MSSSSGSPPASVRLAVTAEPGTEIALIDHNFRVRERRIGELTAELVPGLYKLRYQAGFTVQEAYQLIEPGKEVVRVSAPPLVYSSAAPLLGTRDADPYHQAARELSRKVHASLGEGSQVFVFVQDREAPAGGFRARVAHPAARLSLRDGDGNRLVKLGRLAGRAGATGQWAGCTVAVPPGEYRLRLAAPQWRHLEQAIVASPGWQTQVFLTRSPVKPAEGGWRGWLRWRGWRGGLDPAHTSVLQTRIGDDFDDEHDARRLADLARIGLLNGRAVISLSELPGMLSGPSANPMLGIYAAHAALKAGEFDKAQLGVVVNRLRSLLGRHPDVEALAQELDEPDANHVFDFPPMLSSSWSLILAASVDHPGLVPAGSLPARISANLWGGGPWLLWLGDKLPRPRTPRTVLDAPGVVERVATTALLRYSSRREALGNKEIDGTEEALLTRVARPFGTPASSSDLKPYRRQAHPGKSLDPDLSSDHAAGVSPDLGAGISRDLVKALDLPPAAIPPVADSLVRKLEHASRANARFRGLGWRLRGPVVRQYLRSQRPSTGRKRRWRGKPQRELLSVATGALLVIWLVAMIALLSTLFSGSPPGFEIALDDILAATLALTLSVTFGSVVYLWRRSRVHRPHLRRTLREPHRLAGTAGSVTGAVVGRDELCQALIDDLRARGTRRPHVVIGGAGTGKTALLVQVTRELAERGALPVLVRLRDAQSNLDFRELAYQQFIADDDAALLSEADGETVWRLLSMTDKIVVLADGLEEALVGEKARTSKEPAVPGRDYLIRLAIHQARRDGLPLVVTSRPDSSLAATDAAVVDLEPVDQRAARQWLQDSQAGRDGPSKNESRLNWLVTAADVAEHPLYLRIAHQLQGAGLLSDLAPGRGRKSDERAADRAALRLALLETWMNGLLTGRLAAEVPVSPVDREAAVDQLSVLACLGLGRNTRQVTFDDFEALRNRPSPSALITEVAARLQKTGRQFDVGLAAIWGTELGLVEADPNGVRFPDSLVEAYLGSRLIETAMADEDYRSRALTEPGQELLTALVMNSRANNQQVRGQTSPARPAAPKQLSIRDLLRERAIKTTGVTALYCSAAALQVDCVSPSPVHGEIARKIAGRWAGLAARDRRDLDQAKLNLVRRLGEAARVIGGKQAADPGYPGKPAYRELYDIAVAESSEAIRRECAHQIGVNGDAAFNALQGLLGPGDPASPGRKTEAEPGPDSDAHAAVTAADGQAQVAEADDRYWREQAVRAWLAPLFAGSVTRSTADAQKNLAEWLRFVSEHGDRATRGQLLSVGVALAQGFKYAANRCGPPPHANPQAYAVLTEQAREMLKRTGFWYSQLTLIHALCLLSLSGSRSQQSANGRDVDYAALVTHWAGVSTSRSEHPFVTEARHLAVWVLETGQPERFMWIDESSVAATVGSGPGDPHAPHWQDAWIPPTAGWAALHGRAQKLLGDVLILLNLADRGAGPRDRDQYLLRMAPAFLPPCLSRDRSPLDPGRTIGSAAAAPGSHCMAGCPFGLCPYPPQGERNRAELSEAFCRRQRTLVRGRGRRAADLKRFWADMAQRVQP